MSAWSGYCGTPLRAINPAPSNSSRAGFVVQWFNFTTPRASPPIEHDFKEFTMSDAPHSWDNGLGVHDHWVEDPSRPASQPSSRSSDSSHVSASIESNSYDTPPSVPSTEPEAGNERTPVNGSVESGRAVRHAHDGIWRLPDGSCHPRNIYSDSGDDDEHDDGASYPTV